MIVFAFLRIDDDPARAAEVTRTVLPDQAAWLGVDEPFALVGPAAELPKRVDALREAGASTVVLRPLGPDPSGQARARAGGAHPAQEPPR